MHRWTRRGVMCACLCCFASELVFRSGRILAKESGRPEFIFKQIRPGVWTHTSWSTLSNGAWFPSNGAVVIGRDRMLMIDTAWTPDQTELLLARLEPIAAGRLADLFVTHFHDDRMAGLSVTVARGIASYAFARTAKEARRHSMGEIEHALQGKAHAFDLGGRVVEVFYPGPAHTVDNAVVFDQATRVLFGGCMIRALRAKDLGNVADGYVANWAATVSRVAARYPDPDVVVPGHGDAGGRDLYDHTIALARS